jgi:hypothetical protein
MRLGGFRGGAESRYAGALKRAVGQDGDCRSGSGSSGRGERQSSEMFERLGELFGPGPGGVEA